MTYRTEYHNLDGRGPRRHRVYDMPVAADAEYGGLTYWPAVTDVPCPVAGCSHTVVWYEAGYVPGYRVCLASRPEEAGTFDLGSLKHRFLALGNADALTLVLLPAD